MNISEYSVKKPITVLMSMLMLILVGLFSLSKLSVELLPDINLPYAAVVTTYQGANPFEVEEDVTKNVESALMTVGNFKTLNSTSSEHFSIVIIEFSQNINMDTAFLEMREKLDMIEFPDGVGNPSIMKFDPSMMPVMITSITRDFGDNEEQSLIQTSEWIKRDLYNQLESIEGVANIELNGASDTVLELDLNQEVLASYGLSQDDVLRIVESQNIEGLIGVVPDGDNIRMLYLGSNIEGLSELNNVPVYFDSGTDEVVRLKDVANDISFVNQAAVSYNKVNGKDAVTVAFFKQSDVDITSVVDNIKDKLDLLTSSDEFDAEYLALMNQGDYIDKSVGSITNNLLIGGLVAILILFLFLRDIRPTITVALSIPISIIGAFLLMYFFGISLNVISMGGLALGIGMLVDNSIVVIENIYRLLGEGYSRKEASIVGAKQVGVAIIASTLTTIMVFLPVLFIENMIADIFVSMALTVTFSLLASLVIALTLVPSLSSKILKVKRKGNKQGFIYKTYESSLKLALKFKFVLIFIILGLFGLSIYLGVSQGFEMMPASDEGQVNITFEMQKGTTFEKTSEITDYFVEKISSINEIEVTSAEIGGGMMFLGGSNDSSTITILLKDTRKKTSFEIADEIRVIYDSLDFTELPNVNESDVYNFTSSASSSAMGGDMLFGGGIQISVKGEDLYKMEEVANDLVEILEGIEGTKNYSNGIQRTNDIVRLEVNKDNAIKLNLTEKEIMSAIEIFYQSLGFSMMEETNTNLIVPVDGVKYDITLPSQEFNMSEISASTFLQMVSVFDYEVTNAIKNKLDEEDTEFMLYMPNIQFFDKERTIPNPSFVQHLPEGVLIINPALRYNPSTKDIYSITLDQMMNGLDNDLVLTELVKSNVYDGNTESSIVTVDSSATGFASINRDGKTRVLTVSAALETGYQQSLVADEIQESIDNYISSSNFQSRYQNINVELEDTLMTTVVELAIAVLLAILLVYMIMAIQFQSLIYPFIVLFTIPLAFTGAFFALVIFNFPISMPAMVGLIVLTGIIVNNGIVLIDSINQQRKDGKSLRKSLFDAGQTRLRPIFMTAITTSLALFPMALGLGEGGELLQPLAITSIGGLVYATVLTLWVVPVVYDSLTKEKDNEKAVNN